MNVDVADGRVNFRLKQRRSVCLPARKASDESWYIRYILSRDCMPFADSPSTGTLYQNVLRLWLIGPAADLWLDRAVDRVNGGFFDQLSFDRALNSCDFKRLRVCARQIFVFSQLAAWGISGAREAVLHGLDFLFERLRHAKGGFIRSTTLAGAPSDPTRDLYDHAFVIFALANAYRITGESSLRDEALATLNLLRNTMTHPSGGFVESLPPALPRRQNPHMHLLEACLAWLPLTGADDFAETADSLLNLFVNQFYQHECEILFEYFDEQWRLPEDPASHIFEPGHHFEWIWLLGQARRHGLIASNFGRRLARGLATTALARGIDLDTGLPYGAVRRDGGVAESTCRIWVITEWLRACLVEPDSGAGEVNVAARHLLRFLDVPLAGLWHERRDAVTGAFLTEPVPASSLYHIVSALAPIVGRAIESDNLKLKGRYD